MKMFPVFLVALPTLCIFAPGDDRDASGRLAGFKITTGRADDAVAVRAEKDRTVVAVESPSGIGRAVLERPGGTWPEGLVLRLHLKGLEGFRASNGHLTLDAAVSIPQGRKRVRLWKDGNEGAPLNEKSPFWMDIRVIGGDGRPARGLPLKDGHFEMTLPGLFFEGNPKSITLDWIDFYR